MTEELNEIVNEDISSSENVVNEEVSESLEVVNNETVTDESLITDTKENKKRHSKKNEESIEIDYSKFQPGRRISIRSTASTWYDGTVLPQWVKSRRFYIIEVIHGKELVIGPSTSGRVTGHLNIKDAIPTY